MINFKIKTTAVKKLCKSIPLVGHCSKEEIIENNRRNKYMTENKIKIIKNFNNHCRKGCNFNNNHNKRFIFVMAEILKGIVEKENRINETNKMREKAKRSAVKNIVFITGKKQASSKRSYINADKDNADQKGKRIQIVVLSSLRW